MTRPGYPSPGESSPKHNVYVIEGKEIDASSTQALRLLLDGRLLETCLVLHLDHLLLSLDPGVRQDVLQVNALVSYQHGDDAPDVVVLPHPLVAVAVASLSQLDVV